MYQVDKIWEPKNRTAALVASGFLVLVVAFVDWLTKPYVSLGFLYLFPILLAAGFLPRWAILAVAVGCSALSEMFSSLNPSEAPVRLVLVTLALGGCGLLLSEVLRNRRLTLEAGERMRVLIETTPAAIVTVNDQGFIEMANQAAIKLLAPQDGQLMGLPIAIFLPDLHHALRREEGPQFRASMQCQGRRGDGETFVADLWFSTYRDEARPKLAAIITEHEGNIHDTGDSEQETEGRKALTEREVEVLRLVVQGFANKEIAARLTISESSVKNALQQLFAKTAVRSRSQLVRIALERYRDLL